MVHNEMVGMHLALFFQRPILEMALPLGVWIALAPTLSKNQLLFTDYGLILYYWPPSGLCPFPFLDIGFSKSGVLGLACPGFPNIFAARSNSHAAIQTKPIPYNNILGL